MGHTAIRHVLLESSRADSALQERLETKLFAAICLPNGIWKTTHSSRLTDVNAAIMEHLPSRRPLQVMDVAVSSGVSALELSECLTSHGIPHSLLAGDAVLEADLVQVGTWVDLLIQRDGPPLLVAIGDKLITLCSGKWRRAKRALAWWLEWISVRMPLPKQGSGSRGFVRLVSSRRCPVRLLSPRLSALSYVDFVQDDLLRPQENLTSRFDVVRAANIVNLAYFTEAEIRTIVSELSRRLLPEGILVVCRTHEDDTNHGTVFRRTATGQLRVIHRVGAGSEVESCM